MAKMPRMLELFARIQCMPLCSSSQLPDVKPGGGAADDQALDLGGALEDREVVGFGYR